MNREKVLEVEANPPRLCSWKAQQCSNCKGWRIGCGTPDPCVGYIPNVYAACCGHDGEYRPYVTVVDGTNAYSLRDDLAEEYLVWWKIVTMLCSIEIDEFNDPNPPYKFSELKFHEIYSIDELLDRPSMQGSYHEKRGVLGWRRNPKRLTFHY